MRVTGDDGKPASLPDLPRQKLGTCTFRGETTVITIAQRMPVRGLLTDAGIAFENNQEHLVLTALLERLEAAATQSGGEPPAPEPEKVPNIASYKSLSGNDLLAALAADATTLRDKLKAWKAAAQKIGERLPDWRLAERLVALGAVDQQGDLDDSRSGRRLLADPYPMPPLISAAAETLRAKLNAAHADWAAEWQKGEQRLADDPTWGKLPPGQKDAIRQKCGLLRVTKPTVDTPQTIAEVLSQRGLSEWENMTKALPARIEDVFASAAEMLEPKARGVSLPRAMLKSEAELDEWLGKVRERVVKALVEGPVIPKV